MANGKGLDVKGQLGHVKEIEGDWQKAYKEAIEKDDADMIAALEKSASKLQRVDAMGTRIAKQPGAYEDAAKTLQKDKPTVIEGDIPATLKLAAHRNSARRKVNSLYRFIKEVETL